MVAIRDEPESIWKGTRRTIGRAVRELASREEPAAIAPVTLISELRAGGTVLGLFPEVAYEDGETELRPGDSFVGFTDGVTEARSAGGEEFGEQRLEALLRELAGAPAEEVASRLAARMREWFAGAEQYDDLTFVVATVV